MKKPEIIIYTELTDEFQERWQALWDESEYAHFHNSPLYFISCCDAFEPSKYIILTIEQEGRLDAVFPLVWEKKFGITVLCNPGERFTDKSTLLLRTPDPIVIKLLLEKLMTFGNLYLSEMSEELSKLMIDVYPYVVKQETSVSPYLSLLPDPLRFMTSKMRNKIRNRIKRYEKQLEFATYKGDPQGLEIAFEIDARSTKRQHAKSDLASEQAQKFMWKLLKNHKRDFNVDILSYESVPMIYGIGLTYKKTYHAFQTAYDGQYGYLSPGKMLNFFMYDRLVQEGYTLFDYSRGQNYLKKEFTNLSRKQYVILYSKFFGVIWWWKACHFLYNFILQSKLLYGAYLLIKKYILYR